MKSTTQNGLWTMTVGKREASLKAIEDAIAKRGGNPSQLFDRFRTDKSFTDKVAEFMFRERLDASLHQQLARAIMGKNFFGVEDWSALYGVNFYGGPNFGQKQLRQVIDFPWGKDILNSTCPLCGKVVKNCHFAFFGLDRVKGEPLTILKLQKLHPDTGRTGQPRFYSYAPSAWYSEQKFAKETTMDFRWYLLHQNIVPKSEDKTYDEQKAMLTADYEVPSAIAEATKDLFVFRKTGNFVNSSRYARCECVTSDGHRVGVSGFGEGGLSVDDCRGDYRDYRVGVAASRRLPGRKEESQQLETSVREEEFRPTPRNSGLKAAIFGPNYRWPDGSKYDPNNTYSGWRPIIPAL